MRIIFLFLTVILYFEFTAFSKNNFAYEAQEHFAKQGVSGYVSSDYKNTETRTPLEVYELSSYRKRNHNQDYNYTNNSQTKGVTHSAQPLYQQQPSNTYNNAQHSNASLYSAQYKEPPASTVQVPSYARRQYTTQQYGQQNTQANVYNTPSYAEKNGSRSQYNMQQNVYGSQRYVNQRYTDPKYQRYRSMQSEYTNPKHNTTSHLLNYSRYYAVEFSHPFHSSNEFTDEGSSLQEASNNSFIPIVNKNGGLGVYIGRRLQKIPSLRYEYGIKWDLLSFEYENNTQKYDSLLHNLSFNLRPFFDIPISHSLLLSVGAEGGYGVINYIAGDNDSYFTGGISYALLAGVTFQVSKARSLYILLRQGSIPSKNYKVLNTTRNASFSSTSIVFGLQLISL